MRIIPQRVETHVARAYGLKRKELFEIKKTFKQKYQSILEEKGESKKRERAYGGGRKRKLSPDEVLLLTLMKLRYNPTFLLLGWMFEISEASAYRYFRDGLETLEKILPVPIGRTGNIKLIIERFDKGEIQQISTLEELINTFGNKRFNKLVIDGSEQEINSPKDREDRKRYYSGKEKDHTVKIEIMTDGKKVMWLNGIYEGSKHDLKMMEDRLIQELNTFNKEGKDIYLFFDKGYEGVEKKIPSKRFKVYVLQKNRKGLTQEQKEKNRIISQERIVVEHVIGRIKRSRMLLERYRGKDKKDGFPVLMKCYRVVSGLINYGEGSRWREGNLIA